MIDEYMPIPRQTGYHYGNRRTRDENPIPLHERLDIANRPLREKHAREAKIRAITRQILPHSIPIAAA